MLTSLTYLLNVIFTKDAGLGAPHQPDASIPKNPIVNIIKKMAELILVILPGIYFSMELDRISSYLSLPFPREIRPYVEVVSFIIILSGTVFYGIKSLVQLQKCRKENKSFFPENIGTKERKLRAAVAYIASTVAITTLLGLAAFAWGVCGIYLAKRWGVNIPFPIIDL